MKICKKCLYTENHALNIVFDEDGICSGCRIHEEKDSIDWNVKAKELKNLLDSYKNLSGNNYDCIIPVSGAGDSYFIVHMVKNVYKMNPLLVTYNKHFNTDIGIRNLANLRIMFNCDIITLTVNPEKVKKITRATLRRFGSIYWHCIAGQTVFPVQIAVRFKIPLIVWGVHQGVDQVGMFSHHDMVEMTRKFRKEHDLMGFEAEDLIDEFDDISENDIFQFKYPSNEEIEAVGVRGIYLSNFIRWDSKAQHEKMLKIYDYETNSPTRTYDTYNYADCWNYSDIHDYLKLVKHGYSKVTDNVCRDIRLGHINRIQGENFIDDYQFIESIHLEKLLIWLGMTKNSFYYIVDQHRNKQFWKRNDNWNWVYKMPRNKKQIDLTKCNLLKLSINKKNSIFITKVLKKSTDNLNEYILIGKGV